VYSVRPIKLGYGVFSFYFSGASVLSLGGMAVFTAVSASTNRHSGSGWPSARNSPTPNSSRSSSLIPALFYGSFVCPAFCFSPGRLGLWPLAAASTGYSIRLRLAAPGAQRGAALFLPIRLRLADQPDTFVAGANIVLAPPTYCNLPRHSGSHCRSRPLVVPRVKRCAAKHRHYKFAPALFRQPGRLPRLVLVSSFC